MRLAYLCADRGIPLGGNKGASVHVRAVSQALAERGHDVNVVAVRVGTTPPRRFRPRILEVPFDRTLKSLRRSIDGEGRSVLSNEIYSLLLNSVCHEGLVEVENGGKIDGIYERYSLWSVAGLRFARSRGIPFVLEANAPLVLEQEEYRDLELRETAQGIERFLFSQADAIFVPSRELETYIKGRVGERRKIFVTPNGVHTSHFSGPHPLEDESRRSSRDRFTVVFLGSLKPWHGVEVLLRAFKRLKTRVPDATLLVIGDGPMRAEVERLQQEMGTEVVRLTGEVPHHEIPARLRTADVGVAPYPDLEPFYFSPMKVIEYMAAGLPVVASSIGQLDDLVDDGQNGLLVRPGDLAGLVEALESLALDRRLRSRLGRRAQRRALRKYSWQGVASRIEAAFSEVAVRTASSSMSQQEVGAMGSSGGMA